MLKLKTILTRKSLKKATTFVLLTNKADKIIFRVKIDLETF